MTVSMGFRLKEVREKHGLTQEELARKSGISRVTISMIESGKSSCVKTQTLLKLADALGERHLNYFFSPNV